MNKKPEQFEEAFARLSAIVEKLESGEVTLEQSLELYAEGMALVRFCGEKLTAAEQRIERLNEAARAPGADSAPASPAPS